MKEGIKMKYNNAVIEVISFEAEDVITTSGGSREQYEGDDVE